MEERNDAIFMLVIQHQAGLRHNKPTAKRRQSGGGGGMGAEEERKDERVLLVSSLTVEDEAPAKLETLSKAFLVGLKTFLHLP